MKSSGNSTFSNLSNVNSTLDLYYNTTDTISIDVSNLTTKIQFTNLEKSFRPNATDKKVFSMPTTIDSSLNKESTTSVNLSKMKTTETPRSSMENSFTINSQSMNTKSSIENANHLTNSNTDFNKKTSKEIPIPTTENKSSGKFTTMLNDKDNLLTSESMKTTASSITLTKRYSTSKITTKSLENEKENSQINTLDNKSLIKTTDSNIIKKIETIKENPNLSTKNIIDGKLSTLATVKSIVKTEKTNEKPTESKDSTKSLINGKSKFTTEKFTSSTNGKFTTKSENEIRKQNGSSTKYSTKFQSKSTTGKSISKPKRNETKKSIATITTLSNDFKTSQPFKTTENKTTKLMNYKSEKNFSTRTSNFPYSSMISNASIKTDHSVTFINSETTTEPNHTMGAGPLVIVVLLPFLALFLIAVVTALRRKMKKSRGRIVRVQSRDLGNFSDRNQSQMIPLTKPEHIDNN